MLDPLDKFYRRTHSNTYTSVFKWPRSEENRLRWRVASAIADFSKRQTRMYLLRKIPLAGRAMRSRRPPAGVCVFLAAVAGSVWGQSPQSSSGTRATQLPLSGRQQGGTSIQQSATPSSSSSVNTLNTQVDVQGAYAGSVLDPNPPAGSF